MGAMVPRACIVLLLRLLLLLLLLLLPALAKLYPRHSTYISWQGTAGSVTSQCALPTHPATPMGCHPAPKHCSPGTPHPTCHLGRGTFTAWPALPLCPPL